MYELCIIMDKLAFYWRRFNINNATLLLCTQIKQGSTNDLRFETACQVSVFSFFSYIFHEQKFFACFSHIRELLWLREI
jgi:hypothetical protein